MNAVINVNEHQPTMYGGKLEHLTPHCHRVPQPVTDLIVHTTDE